MIGKRDATSSLVGTGDQISVYGMYDTIIGTSASQVSALTHAQANSLVSAMGIFALPSAGQIEVLASAQQPTAVMIAPAY
ncbi:MAG: hypothetical protein HQL87_09695 [Magnetococcales bacterium]|nr:hypothetical protein [Magnetococcales bacterium]